MVKYLLVNAFIFLTFLTFAQTENKDVVITSSGSGISQELAKQTALRNAIEQAFGTFISSKTEIFNDEIVADQMSSVSSGNVKSYEVLNESQLPNGTWASTLRVIVSVDKLTTFVEAKGITIEIKGGLFALNIKQQLLNEQGEINAITEMFGVLHEVMQTAFDFTIQSGDPKSLDAESKNWEIPLTITATANKNMDFCANYFTKTLSAISLTQAEVATYKSLNKDVFTLEIQPEKVWEETKVFYLRKKISMDVIERLISNWEFYTRLFTVQTGIDELYDNRNKSNTFFSDLFWNGGYSSDKEILLMIKFPTFGQIAGTFKFGDKRLLSQIEQMTGYSVKPRGVMSNFKHGGYVVYEKDGHGLVAAITDLAQMDWNSAKTLCDELILNEYSDWYLPSKDELNSIYVNSKQLGVGILFKDLYWSSTEENRDLAWYVNFSRGYVDYTQKYSTMYVLSVRAF